MAESSDSEPAEQSEPPQLVVQQFSMEALHHIMLTNNCQILGMYDEMSVMYGQLDAYKHSGSRLDRSTLLDLYNGGSWSRNFRNKDQAMIKMQQTSFNMCGFIQPTFILNMLDSNDPDAFNDRQFFICPEEVEYMYGELKVPMDPTVGQLEDIFRRIKAAHQNEIVYTFSDDAQVVFIRAHDDLCTRKISIKDDEDRRGILSKSKGQLARMAMVIHSLEQAVTVPMPSNDVQSENSQGPEWTSIIESTSVMKAKTIMKYIIEQKFALMQPEIRIPTETESILESINTGRQKLDSNPKYLSKFLTFRNTEIQASDVSQFRLMPPTPKNSTSKNKYPVDECKRFMKEVSEAGFGTIHEVQKSGSLRKAYMFCKRPYGELGNEQQQILKKLRVNELLYNASPMTSSSSTPDDESFLFGGSNDEEYATPMRMMTLSTPDSQLMQASKQTA